MFNEFLAQYQMEKQSLSIPKTIEYPIKELFSTLKNPKHLAVLGLASGAGGLYGGLTSDVPWHGALKGALKGINNAGRI